MKAPLILAAGTMLVSPLCASPVDPNIPLDPNAPDPQIEAANVPEPNPILFAGLGGLVLLMCAVRRK